MNETLTFETYAAAKIAGGTNCKIITTGPSWSGSESLKNKFKIYTKGKYRMYDRGWVFANVKDYCLSYTDFSKIGYLQSGDYLEHLDGTLTMFDENSSFTCNDTRVPLYVSKHAPLCGHHEISYYSPSYKNDNLFVLLIPKNLDVHENVNDEILEYKKQIEMLKDINNSNLKTIEKYANLIQSMTK